MSGGCTKDDPKQPCILRPQPAFRVQLTADGGALPPDTQLVVQYQGTVTERYALGTPPAGNEDVCCRPLPEPVEGDLPPVRCGGSVDAGETDAARDARPEASPDAAFGQQMDADAESPDAARRDAGQAGPMDASRDAALDAPEGGRPDAGPPPPAGPKALVCQLWTDGEAKIRITASGFDEIERILDAKFEEARCGLETVDVHIQLSGADAGR